jgi:16S rRNA G966 N2-methylase RsmD
MFLFDLSDLKARMTVIIESEEKTVKTMKKNIEALNQLKTTMEQLQQELQEDRQIAERFCEKLILYQAYVFE